jgi:hypothetical protein
MSLTPCMTPYPKCFDRASRVSPSFELSEAVQLVDAYIYTHISNNTSYVYIYIWATRANERQDVQKNIRADNFIFVWRRDLLCNRDKLWQVM